MGHAVITGGSSGIGLALGIRLAQAGHRISIIARDPARLAAASADIARVAPGAKAFAFAADVGDSEACADAVARAIRQSGPPNWAIACAGIVQPGLFAELRLSAHEDQMRTNYFGSLNFARAAVPAMIAAGGGRLIFVSSAAALVGIYGFSAYGPSKFAVRGLAETLRVELRARGIAVTLVYPPDTDTPQFAGELAERPAETSRIAAGGGVWQAADVARLIIDGATRGRFIVAPGWRLRALNRWHSVIAPLLRLYQQFIARNTAR